MYKYSKTDARNGHVRKKIIKRESIPEHARWLIYENKIILHKIMPLKKVIETKLYSGVEALRYLGLAKRYVCKRYNVTSEDLEILLFLYPFNYFTKRDYDRIAQTYTNRELKTLEKRGLVVVIYNKESLKMPNIKKKDLADIYTLSVIAKRSVNYFYKILTGDMKPFGFEKGNYSKSETKNKLIKDLLEEMKNQE